jgi:hypothetical protein
MWGFEVFEIHHWLYPPFFFFGKPKANGFLILQFKIGTSGYQQTQVSTQH